MTDETPDIAPPDLAARVTSLEIRQEQILDQLVQCASHIQQLAQRSNARPKRARFGGRSA